MNTSSKRDTDLWANVDWPLLERLRARLLEDNPAAQGDYWESEAHLWNYEFTFGQRILWKWAAVLRELENIQFPLPTTALPLWDLGCGPGQVSRFVTEQWGSSAFSKCTLIDRSPRACQYAEKKFQAEFPKLEVGTTNALPGNARGVLLLSHVANELSSEAWKNLLQLLPHFQLILWVEPGMPATAKRLVQAREQLLSSLIPVAPCPHAGPCGMTVEGNARHWCHQFTAAPPEVPHTSGWSQFAKHMHIDLRSLPYSYMVLASPNYLNKWTRPSNGTRLIGRARMEKGRARLLVCGEHLTQSLQEGDLQKRDEPELFKQFHRQQAESLLTLTMNNGKFIRQKD